MLTMREAAMSSYLVSIKERVVMWSRAPEKYAVLSSLGKYDVFSHCHVMHLNESALE